MNARNTIARLAAAASALAVTVWLFGAVVSLAEPQRSVLIAKLQQQHEVGQATTTVALATSRRAPAAN